MIKSTAFLKRFYRLLSKPCASIKESEREIPNLSLWLKHERLRCFSVFIVAARHEGHRLTIAYTTVLCLTFFEI